MKGMRRRSCIAIALVMAAAWYWHREPSVEKQTADQVQSPSSHAGIGELIARIPTPAQLKLRPLYVFEGGLRLEGQTVDEEKRPIGGVKVTLNGTRSVVSNADGSFAFDHLAEADYAVTAEKNFTYAEDTLSLRDNSEPMELEMKTSVGMRVHVESTSQRPIRDAAIDIGRRSAVTDGDGNALVRGLAFNGERLTVIANGYGPQRIDVATGDDPRVQLAQTVVLQPGALFAGTVVDQAGKPAPNASVTIAQANWYDRIDADQHGHFEVPYLGRGKVMASAYSDENIANPDEAFTLDGVHPTHDAVIHVTTGARVTGIVLDASGNPVVKVQVWVGKSSEHTDLHGHFEIKGIEPGLLEVSANNETMAAITTKVEVTRARVNDLRIQMVVSSIAGTVRDAQGQPVEDASVQASGQNGIGSGYTRSDEHGKFDLGGIPPGVYEITVQRNKDRGSSPTGVMVHTGTHDLALTLGELGGIAGRVVEHGVAVEYFGSLVSDDPDPSWTRTPDSVRNANGAFAQKDLRPGVYSVALVGSFQRKVIPNIRIIGGAITQLGDITVDPGRIVRGVVRDDHGVPIAGATVAIASRVSMIDDDSLGGKAGGTQTAHSDAAGNFELSGLEGGTLYIQATHDHDMAAPRELATDESSVELVITHAGSLDGTIVNERGRYTLVTVTASDGMSYSESTDSVGNFHFDRLPPGDYKLAPQYNAVVLPRHVYVEPGTTTSVTFELSANPIAVTVQNAGCTKIYLEALDVFQDSERCDGGTATFKDVEPGTYRACADGDRCSTITVATSPNQQTVTIQNPPVQPTGEEPAMVAPDDPAMVAPE